MPINESARECEEEAEQIIRSCLPNVLRITVDRQLVQATSATSRDKAAMIAKIIETKLSDYHIVPRLTRKAPADQTAADLYEGPKD